MSKRKQKTGPLMNHEIRRARDRFQILTPIPEKASSPVIEEALVPVKLPPIPDVQVEDERPAPRRQQRSKTAMELENLIGGYLDQAVKTEQSVHIGYDPTLYCECCEPINYVSKARLQEFSSGTLSPAEEPDHLGHYKAKEKQGGVAVDDYHKHEAQHGDIRREKANAASLFTQKQQFYSGQIAHQPFHVMLQDANVKPNSGNNFYNSLFHPRIYVDASRSTVPPTFRYEQSFQRPEASPAEQRQFDMRYMQTVMDAASKFDNSMQGLESTIRSLRSDRRVTIDEMENTYHHFDKT